MIRPLETKKIKFSKLADAIGIEYFGTDFEVTGVAQNADEVRSGDIFLAIAGEKHHGAEFAALAAQKGAVAVITDAKGSELSKNLPTVVVGDPRKLVGELAAAFYDQPMKKMFTVGITGTNGKTTVTTLLHQIWQTAGWSSGLIGTINTLIDSEVLPSRHTTPEAADLQAIMATMSERHIRSVAMEVSSHALELNRIIGCHFNIAGFTNLTQDHLDFHENMENYFNAKAKLFQYGLSEQAVINIDNDAGTKLAKLIKIPVTTVSRMETSADWHYESIDQDQVKIRGAGGILIEGRTSLIGAFNLDNLLMAVAIAYMSGIDPIEISTNLSKYRGAPGRFEKVEVGQKFTAFVDYAHTPDAVNRVLAEARKLTNGSVIAVLGCGGDRDRSKRPLMGDALVAGSDIAIFTSDNPRSEDPIEILKQMSGEHKGEVIVDRKMAIERAVALAKPGDVVAVLGKGHETGQEIQGKNFPFDDAVILANAIAGN